MDTSTILLEAFLFRKGRPVKGSTISWKCSEEWAVVDEQHRLKMTGTGPLTISAMVDEEPQLSTAVSTIIALDLSTSIQEMSGVSRPLLFPNPAGEVVRIQGVDGTRLTLFDASGSVLKKVDDYREGSEIAVGDLMPGIYMLKLGNGKSGAWLKLMKQ